MPRPCKNRVVEKDVEFTCFKPAWIPKSKLEKIELQASELEALRLSNLENFSQKIAAEKMWVSAPTFNRLLKSASKKITDALVNGKWIRIYKKDWTWNCK